MCVLDTQRLWPQACFRALPASLQLCALQVTLTSLNLTFTICQAQIIIILASQRWSASCRCLAGGSDQCPSLWSRVRTSVSPSVRCQGDSIRRNRMSTLIPLPHSGLRSQWDPPQPVPSGPKFQNLRICSPLSSYRGAPPRGLQCWE